MQNRMSANNEIIFETAYLNWMAQAIYIAAKLDLPELLASGSLTLSELAAILRKTYPHLSHDNLYRLMRNLSTIGVFTNHVNDTYGLGPLGTEMLNPKVIQFIITNNHDARRHAIANLGEWRQLDHLQDLFNPKNPGVSPDLFNLVLGYRYAKSLYLFTKYRLAECLNQTAASSANLACRLNLDVKALDYICELLREKKILNLAEGKYSLTEAGELLLKGNDKSLRNFVLHENIARWQAAANLMVAVTEGKQPFHATHQNDLFDMLKQPGEEQQIELDIFNQAMAEVSSIEISAIVQHLNIPANTETLMDVGGGTGALMNALLEKHPHINGIIFDLPETVQQVSITKARCKAVGGNFFEKESIPAADMLLLKRTLHDWTNEQAIEILRHCAEKCSSLVVIEWLWKESCFVACLDFALMAIGGRIRSADEFSQMMEAANLQATGSEEIAPGIFTVKGAAIKKNKYIKNLGI